MTFAECLADLYQRQFTGPLLVQFGQGVPSAVEFPQPTTKIRLDKPSRSRGHLTATVDSRLTRATTIS